MEVIKGTNPMKCEVTLYNSGKVFKETMYARDYQQARQVALSRNPGSTHVSTTAVFEPVDANCSFTGDSSSSSSSSSFSSSGGSSIGLGGLIILGGLVALISVFGGGEDTETYEYFEPDTTVELKRVKQEDFTWDPLSPPSVNYEAPFFAQDGIQEEAIDDLGQNWDN